MAALPVVDIATPEQAAPAIEAACRDVGFMYVTGHGIPAELIAAMRQQLASYFSQPLAAKRAQQISADNYRGYIPLNFFSPANSVAAVDAYEGYKLHYEIAADDPIVAQCDLYGPNIWPDLPGFRATVLAYWRHCDRVAEILLRALAGPLGIAADEFLAAFAQPLTNMTLLHYPPQAATPDAVGIHAHKDTDAITLLAPDPVGGLLVKSRHDNSWLHAEPHGDALIVNIGDLLELWSGGYFVSTPHKVVNLSAKERYSFPYFSVPRYNTVVAPLRQPQSGFDRANVDVGAVSREVWRMNWPGARAEQPQFDLGTLQD